VQTAARAPLCSLLFSGFFGGANEGALARKDKPRAKTIPVNRPEHLIFAKIQIINKGSLLKWINIKSTRINCLGPLGPLPPSDFSSWLQPSNPWRSLAQFVSRHHKQSGLRRNPRVFLYLRWAGRPSHMMWYSEQGYFMLIFFELISALYFLAPLNSCFYFQAIYNSAFTFLSLHFSTFYSLSFLFHF